MARWWLRGVASLSMFCAVSASHAAPVYLSFEYDFEVTSIPDDNIPDYYSLADSGFAVVDFDVDYSNPNTVYPGVHTALSTLAYNPVADAFDLSGSESGLSFFKADIPTSSAPGVHKFSFTLSDFGGLDRYNIPGGTEQAIAPTGTLVGEIAIGGFPVVPLPSSAPLFGTALVGLAAAGYAAKRKKAAAA